MMEMVLSGFLFWFILVLAILMGALGYLWEKDGYNPDADLKKINNNQERFKTSIALALIHNSSIIALSVLLFIVFSPCNLILALVLTTFRIGEGLLLFSTESNYLGFVNIASKYSSAIVPEKKSLSDFALGLFKTKDRRFKVAMICWSIGTLAFSIMIVTSEVVPQLVGWLGILASIIVLLGNCIKILEQNVRVPAITALFPILFETIVGGWLLFSPLI